MIARVDQDLAIVWWESHQVPRQECQDVFDKLGYGRHVPKPDIQAACYAAAQDLVERYSIKAGGRLVKYFPLAVNNGDCYGYEVRRYKKGQKKNDLPFLFSIGVYEDATGNRWIEVRDCDPNLCPQISNDAKAAGDRATEKWKSHLATVTATDLTQAIGAMLKENAGLMRRKGGIVWTIPKKHLADYLAIAQELQPHGVEMTGGAFSVDDTANSDLVESTVNHVSHHLKDVLAGLIEGCKSRKDAGIKSRSNGRNSRMEEWTQCSKVLEHYRGLLGPLVEELDEALESAKCALADEAMREFAEA
jgi:hypothetical protein